MQLDLVFGPVKDAPKDVICFYHDINLLDGTMISNIDIYFEDIPGGMQARCDMRIAAAAPEEVFVGHKKQLNIQFRHWL